MPIGEFLEHGTHRIERSEDCKILHIGHQAFIANPEANPLPTASGKLEICCQSLANALSVYNTEKYDATPRYMPSAHGYEASFARSSTTSAARGQTTTAYSSQAMCSLIPFCRWQGEIEARARLWKHAQRETNAESTEWHP